MYKVRRTLKNIAMKRIILTSILFISILVKGQIYYPFPTDNAIWSVFQNEFPLFPFPQGCIAIHYGMVADTVINGVTYSKLYGNNLPADYPYSDTVFNISTATYVAAVREDMSKKIWIRQPNDTIDILYYDFSLQLGDTFCFDFFNIGCLPVVNVDSILINGNYRRQIHFSSFNPEIWIEGIGSKTGWFVWPYIATTSHNLQCYKENQILLYGNNYCHCDTYTSIQYLDVDNNLIKIYPIPTSYKINIEIEENKRQKYLVEIYSMEGEKIKSIDIENQLTKINMSGFPEGVYLLLILSEEGKKWSKKIIKNAP
jgi:hypothetical protein